MTSSGTPRRAHLPKADIGNRKINGAQTPLTVKLIAPQYVRPFVQLLSNLVFEGCRSCGDLVWVRGFNSVFERDAGDDFGEAIEAA